MIKYITTLNDIIGSHVKYFLYSKLNVTQNSLGRITLNDMIPADMSKSRCRDIMDSDEEGDYILDVIVSDTNTAKYASVGSLIFVVDQTPIGYYNFPKMVNIKQSINYHFRIKFDQIACSVSNMVISTDLVKYNPNIIQDKGWDSRIDHSILEISDYNSYTPAYKKNRINELVPTDSNPRFTSLGGVFQYKDHLMNWATNFIKGRRLEAEIKGAKFIYGKEMTSLILWNDNRVFKYTDIHSERMELLTKRIPDSMLNITYKNSSGESVTEQGTIFDCGQNMILIGTPQLFKVITINWNNLNLFDYSRIISNTRYYIDNLDNDINIINKFNERFDPNNIRTSVTKGNWVTLSADASVAFSLAQYGKYMANYRDTFVLEKIDYGNLNGLIILGGGGIGANIGITDLQAPPVGIPEGYEFYDLIEQGKLRFEFLSTSLIRMYAESEDANKPYLFDNIIFSELRDFKCLDTLEALKTKLRFIRVTSSIVSKSDKLVFGDRIAFKFSFDGTYTTITQI
jgi:hypothetical protein